MRSTLSHALVVCLGTMGIAAGIANAQTVVTSIPLTGTPAGVGVDPVARKVYVAEGSQVEVISENTNRVVNRFNLPTSWTITDVKPNPATGLIYVGTEYGGLYVVDSRTYFPVGYVNVDATGLAVDPLTDKIYASDFVSTVAVVDGKSNMIDTLISLSGVENLAVNPFTNRIYAALGNVPGELGVIDGASNQVIAQVPGGGFFSFGVAVDSLHNAIYTTDSSPAGSATVSVFDGRTNTHTATVTVPGTPAGITVDPVTRKVYEADYAGSAVNLINGNNRQSGTLTVGPGPEYLDIDAVTGAVYVGVTGQNELAVVKGR